MSQCDAAQFSDQMVCPCGLRWHIDEPPPKCPLEIPEVGEEWFKKAKLKHPDYRQAVHDARRQGIAVHELSDRQVSQAQRRLSRLYSEPHEALWAIVDIGSKWFAFAVIIVGRFRRRLALWPALLVDVRMIVKPISYENARRLSRSFNVHHRGTAQDMRINGWLNDLISAAAREEALKDLPKFLENTNVQT